MRELRRVLAPLVALAVLAVPVTLALAAGPAAPTVTTAGATAVTNTAATANGTVNPNGQGTFYAFQWGPNAGYGHETSWTGAGSGTTAQAVSGTLADLTPGTTYHFRIIALSSAGSSVGADQTLKTTGTAPAPSPRPVVVTQPASPVTAGGATLHGTVNPAGRATTYVFEYGTSTVYGAQTSPVSAGAGAATVAASAAITGSAPGVTIHYRLVAYSVGGTTLGADATFHTTTPPILSTGAATGIASDSATVSGTVNPEGHGTSYQFQFGTTLAYGLSTPPAGVGSGSGDIAVHQTLAALLPGTAYHYRVVASSSQGTAYGSDGTFTTAGGGAANSRVSILARTGFVAPHGGYVGIGLGCFGGSSACNGSFTFTRGATVYLQQRFTLLAESGGFFDTRLSGAVMRVLFRHYQRPVAVRVNLTTASGQHFSQVIHLVRWY